MNRDIIRQWLETKADFGFSRSSGPGGQNVNKVNTKVELRVDLRLLEGISEAERSAMLEKLAPRLVGGSDGQPGTELLVKVQDTRSQFHNRDLALERILETIEGALRRERPRHKTKPSRASVERRLEKKKREASVKRNRSGRVDREDS